MTTPLLARANRLLADLTDDDRSDLLESLVVALCVNPDQAQGILGSFIDECDFQHLTQGIQCELREFGRPEQRTR